MNQKEWYAKLEKWAFDDARLHRLPLALLPALAEHLANHDAAEQSVLRTVKIESLEDAIANAYEAHDWAEVSRLETIRDMRDLQ